MNLLPFLPFAATIFLSAGCYSRIAEKKPFIVSNSQSGDISLVTVTVDGYAEMSDMKFRAGFRDSAAVDEVLKGDTEPITAQADKANEAPLNATAVLITEDLLTRLRLAYSNNASIDEIDRIEADIARARSLPRIVVAAETSLVSQAPAQKFLVVFSADPSTVFKAIADTNARNESEGAIFQSLRDFENDERTRQDGRNSVVKITWESLLTSVRASLPNSSSDNSTANHELLRTQLLRYQTLLNDFIVVHE